MMRKVVIAGALVLASAAVALAGGIPKGNNQARNRDFLGERGGQTRGDC